VNAEGWLIVSLGNPGPRYAMTRHNIGFLAGDLIAQTHGLRWKSESRWSADLADGGNFLLLKPLTFMNASGDAVSLVAAFHKLPPERILVLADEIALPFGMLRLRKSGSAGGHNGLKSIASRLGTQNYPRLRLGVGGAKPEERSHPQQDVSDFVLAPFNPQETEILPAFLKKAAECVESSLKSGLDVAMNSFNQYPKTQL
jgi:PTH1 family peptidyl-tRNA hydrolase